MRAVVVGPQPPLIGGIVAHTCGAIEALRHAGHEVLPVGFRRLYPNWMTGPRPGSRPGVANEALAIDPFSRATWRASCEGIRGWKPDAVVVQYWNPLLGLALRRILGGLDAAVRIVVCHNVVSHEPLPGGKWILRRLLRECDAAVFHSDHVADAANRDAGPLESVVVPMPFLLDIDPEMAVCPLEIEDLRRDARALVVCPGHVRGYKGVNVLVRAWRDVGEAGDAILIVAGEPLAWSRSLARLTSLGTHARSIPRYLAESELTWLLSRADVVVLPHRSGSQSGLLPVALRLAGGVVATSVVARTSLTEDLDAARTWIVPPDDAGALASALRDALGGPAPRRRFRASRQGPSGDLAGQRTASWGPFLAAIEAFHGRRTSNSGRGPYVRTVSGAAL